MLPASRHATAALLVLLTVFVGLAAAHTSNEAGRFVFQFDDGYDNTSSTYPCGEPDTGDCALERAAFINETGYLRNVSGGGTARSYNVTGPNGEFIARGEGIQGASGPYPINLSIANATVEGRYEIWNISSPLGSGNNIHKHIDLLDANNSNVTGRILIPPQVSLTGTPTVSLYWWENRSERATNGYKINITQPVAWDGPNVGPASEEYLYQVNFSDRVDEDRYFIGVDGDGIAETTAGSRAVAVESEFESLPSVASPRINDFFRFRTPVRFNATVVWASNGSAVGDIELRMRTKCGETPRCPNPNLPGFFRYKPPSVTNTTNVTPSVPHHDGDEVYFTGLANVTEGFGGPSYDIRVTDNSLARTQVDGFRGADFRWKGDGPDGWQSYDAARGNITVTPWTGSINGSIVGADDAGYVLVAFPGSATIEGEGTRYVSVVDNRSNLSMGPLPNGTYSLFAAQFTGGGAPVTTSQSVTVRTGETATVDMEIPTLVNLTGNVTDGPGPNARPVGDARVTVENESQQRFFSARTKKSGAYRMRVVNETNYTVTVVPPFDSDYTQNSTDVAVDGATVRNVTLSGGATMYGYVKDGSGSVVPRAAVEVTNFSQRVFKFDQVGQNGRYNVSGLTRGINYTVEASTADGRNSTKTLLPAGADRTMQNITVARQRANYTGNVTDGSGPVNATVTVLNQGNGSRIQTETNMSGGFAFGGLPQGTYFRVAVEPDDTGLARASRTFRLSGNLDQTIALSRQTGISGHTTFSNGTAVSGVSVYASNPRRDSFGYTRSGPDGSYRLDVKNVSHDVDVFKAGYPLNETNVSAEPGGVTQDLIVPLGENLSGHITQNGKILQADGSIGVYNFSANSFGFTDIDNGAYSFDGLKNASHNVWINVDREAVDVQTTTVGWRSVTGPAGHNVSVPGNKGQRLNVTVVNGNGAPVASATVRTPGLERETNENGTAAFPNRTAASTIPVAANKEGYRGTIRSVDIGTPCTGQGCQVRVPKTKALNGSSFTDDPLTITNIQELEATVNLTNATGGNVSDASVVFSANATDISLSGGAVTDDAGEATVSGLGVGGFLVTAASNSTAYTATTQLRNGGSKTLDVGPFSLFYEVSKP